MSVLLYPLAAVAVVVVASVVMWFRSRQPTSIESGIEAFSREMRALSPESDNEVPRRSFRAPSFGSARHSDSSRGG